MFNQQDFVKCFRDNLKSRGFKKKRMDEIERDYRDSLNTFMRQGVAEPSASAKAQRDTLDMLTINAQERAKATAKMLSVQAQNMKRVAAGSDVTTSRLPLLSRFLFDGKRASKGTSIARAAVATIEDDARFEGLSYSGVREAIRGQLYAVLGSTLDEVGRGAFGRQRGKAHLPNIAREMFRPGSTGDASARAAADSFAKVFDLTVELFNNAGGRMGRIDRYLPQAQTAVNMLKAGEQRWIDVHMDGNDWSKSRWPDGSIISPAQRRDVLQNVYQTKTTDGATKIDPKAFRGRGAALGNQVDNNRFLHFKSADAWLEAHEEFGEGNVFEALTQHIEQMAHRIALVEQFGPNPEMTANNMRAIVRSKAAEHGPEAVTQADAVMKNKFDPMFSIATRENPIDPHSNFGALVTGTSNILTSAMLGSASLLAISGDFMQTAAVRSLTGSGGLFDGTSTYLKTLSLLNVKEQEQIATQSGFVMDQVVMATFSMTRFTGMATVGPAASRHLSEATMRLSLLSGHTKAARWAVQYEYMGMMHRNKGKTFDQLPFNDAMRRYGITPDDWDAFRKIPSHQPKKGAEFLRPLDVMQSGIPNRQVLYQKFQVMITDEARRGVPTSTIEAQAFLRGDTRPDTIPGALLYSFAMWKNFPVSFAMIYGRLGMTSPSVTGRLKFYAGLFAGMTMVGAIGTQLREVSRGRDPMPMDNPAFLGKAFLSGGALSIWGDFLFSGVNAYAQGPQDLAAGPIVQFAGDSANLLLGDVFEFADTLGSLSDGEFNSKTPARAVEYARRYTPGASIWWARKALEVAVFDRLQELADPQGYRKKRNAMVRNRKRDRGQGYFWKPGERLPDRMPQFGD